MEYHKIKNIADQERMLEEILSLRSEIRSQREKKRRLNTTQHEKYTKIFEPVTSTIAKLAPQAAPQPAPADAPAPAHAPPEPDQEVKEEDEKFYDEPNNELFRRALYEVPENLRSDGVLGLDIKTHTIGDYEYEIEGDKLRCVNEDSDDEAVFEINSLELWMLLLVKNPTRIQLKLKTGKEYLPFVYEFKDIADRLQLIVTSQHFHGFHLRKKYKILQELEHAGGGFLFTTRPPVRPDTVVVPSDKVGLLRKLYTAVAELRAGNTSMQNIVVPLAAEARRLGCLPRNLLSPEEETWVFA